MATWIDRTQTSGNRQIFTYSAWVKFTGDNLTSYAHLATTNPNPGNWDTIRLDNNRKFEIICNDNNNILRTSRVFRDTNAWYHFVVAVDTTQSTDTNRTKLYVNGVQETSFESTGYPPQNHSTNFNTNSQTFRIGHNTWSTGGGEYFTGLMSHVHWIDGTQYQASDFGEYDANGVWKIKTSPSVTYGTNGFFIFKDSQSITDQSGNSNNFTVASGTLTNTEDNPSNVFSTINPLDATGCTLSLGNNRTAFSSSFNFAKSTLGWSAGKYYMEAKASTITDRGGVGIVKSLATAYSTSSIDSNRIFYHSNGNVYTNVIDGGSTSVATISQGDIVGIEVDMTAGTCKFYKNGSAILTVTSSIISDNEWQFLVGGYSITWDTNFGNGYFGTTAVSSAGTNASGIGIFEYDVPTGYTALSTKGLNL